MSEGMYMEYARPGSSIFSGLCILGHDPPLQCLCMHSLSDKISAVS